MTEPSWTIPPNWTVYPSTVSIDHRHCKKCGIMIPADKDYCNICAITVLQEADRVREQWSVPQATDGSR